MVAGRAATRLQGRRRTTSRPTARRAAAGERLPGTARVRRRSCGTDPADPAPGRPRWSGSSRIAARGSARLVAGACSAAAGHVGSGCCGLDPSNETGARGAGDWLGAAVAATAAAGCAPTPTMERALRRGAGGRRRAAGGRQALREALLALDAADQTPMSGSAPPPAGSALAAARQAWAASSPILRRVRRRRARGRGRGERGATSRATPGSGKSALVACVRRHGHLAGRPRWHGACAAAATILVAPRSLGPFQDMAADTADGRR